MAGVYVYDYDEVDLDTTGRVGDLQPVECYFEEEKNGESKLTMRLLYDALNKWAAVKVGSYIKAMVPVRVPPKITQNAYDHEVMTYRVKSGVDATATVWQSYGQPKISDGNTAVKSLFYAVAYEETGVTYKEVQVKRRIAPGTEVQVLEMREDGTCRVYAPGVGKGWTLTENLEQVVSTTIPATFNGVESAVTPSRLEYQLFQVVAVEQTVDYIDVTAQHVFYELLHTYTTYTSDNPVEAFAAIDGVFGGMVVKDERFTCLTDCHDKAGALDYERKNIVTALLDPDEGICAQYGLSMIRDNYDVYLLKEVGSDRGFVVEYSKNMLDVDRTEDITDVVTRIIPMGRTKNGDPVYLDGTIWVDSEHIGDYSFPRTMYLDCSDTATEDDTMTLAQVKENLRERALAEFAAGCDLPVLSMTVEFLSLGDTEEYRQYRGLDKVYLYDKITVKDRVRGYDYNAEVVSIKHNVLTGLLESVTLGSIKKGTGVRKIGTWQVPEVDGSNIRLQSIEAGVLAGGAIVEKNLRTGCVSARTIEADAVTAEKIAAGAVTADKIEAGSITTDKLAAKSVTADKIAAGAVTATTIEAGSITADRMVTGTITAASGILADSCIGTTQIADGSITSAKIVSLNADVITAGTLSAERLMLKGEDGLYYKINADSDGVTAAELTDEKYQNYIDGSVLVAKSVTTDQLAANAVTANNILAGAITTAKLSANAVTADKIAAGAITTKKVSSDFGSSLDLSSNESINSIVSELPKTFVQLTEPTGTFNVGDVWIQIPDENAQRSTPGMARSSAADATWENVSGLTWEDVAGATWGDLSAATGEQAADQPRTYVWDGSKWVLTVDYNAVVKNSTEIVQTSRKIEMKANKGDPASGVETSTVTISADGVNIKTGGAFTVDSQKFDIDEKGEMSAVNARISGQLSVDGHDVWHKGNIIVSTAMPDTPAPGMIWVKPDMTGIPAAGTWSHEALPARPWSNNYIVELSGTSIGAAPDGATYTYEVSVPVYYSYDKTDTCTCTVYLGATSGAKTISMGTQSFNASNAGGNTYKATVTSSTWLGNSGKIYMLVSFSSGNLMTVNSYEAFACTLMAKSASAAGWKVCDVQMYVG